jgi:hypothetical protein
MGVSVVGAWFVWLLKVPTGVFLCYFFLTLVSPLHKPELY